MTDRPVIHDTFVIERAYPASASRVFAAFASREAKDAWGDTGDIAEAEPATGPVEFDFRIGGHERFGNVYQGIRYTYDALYYDIVPDQRLVYDYEMYADGVRISVSVATIEFAGTGDGTTLTWTEQGAYLDGFDGEDAPRLRQGARARCSTASPSTWPWRSLTSGLAEPGVFRAASVAVQPVASDATNGLS